MIRSIRMRLGRWRNAWHVYWMRRHEKSRALRKSVLRRSSPWVRQWRRFAAVVEQREVAFFRGMGEWRIWRIFPLLANGADRVLDWIATGIGAGFSLLARSRPARWLRQMQAGIKRVEAVFFMAVGEVRRRIAKSRRLQAVALCAVLMLAAGAVWTVHKIPAWRADFALAQARRAVAKGEQAEARLAVERAVRLNPYKAEAWRLVATVAERGGEPGAEIFWSRAAAFAPGDVGVQLNCARAALAADSLGLAGEALARVPGAEGHRLIDYELLSGELARRSGRFGEAEAAFARAVELDPGRKEAVLALGTMRTFSTEEARRVAGVALLNPLRGDARVGVDALRALLGAAERDREVAQVLDVAEALQTNPQRSIADLVSTLEARSKVAPAALEETLRALMNDRTLMPDTVAAVMGWLNARERWADTVAWAAKRDAAESHRPPVCVGVADALRLQSDWAGLRAWSRASDWKDLEVLGAAYQALAASQLGDKGVFQQEWQRAIGVSRANPGQQHFLAGIAYTWGLRPAAVDLWWTLARDPAVGVRALGALARHYQLQRDADGLARAFFWLYQNFPSDGRIANNFAYLAALVDSQPVLALGVAQENHLKYPDNAAYASTWAFVLWRAGRLAEASSAVDKLLPSILQNEGIAFTCGLVLAEAGRREEARRLLTKVDRKALTQAEENLMLEGLKRTGS